MALRGYPSGAASRIIPGNEKRPISRPFQSSSIWSHLRDLNSRPTVYETAVETAACVPDRPEPWANPGANGHESNGTTSIYGPRNRSAGGPADRPAGRPGLAAVIVDLVSVAAKVSSLPAMGKPDPRAVLQAFLDQRGQEARASGRALALHVLADVLEGESVRLALAVLRAGSHADQRLMDLCELLLSLRAAVNEHAA